MKKPVTSEIRSATNLVVNEANRVIYSRAVKWFTAVMIVNVFLWGLFLAEYRELNRNYEKLQDKHDLTQIMINKYVRNKNE